MASMDRHLSAANGFSRKDLCVRPNEPITSVTRVSRMGPQPMKGSTQADRNEKALEQEQHRQAEFQIACETLEARLRQAVWARSTAHVGEERTLKQAFAKFDKDHSGNVDLDEFKYTLEHLGLHCNEGGLQGQGGMEPAVVEMLFSRYDADGGGTISYDEFCTAFLKEGDMYKLPKML